MTDPLREAAAEMVQSYIDIEGDVINARTDAAFDALRAALASQPVTRGQEACECDLHTDLLYAPIPCPMDRDGPDNRCAVCRAHEVAALRGQVREGIDVEALRQAIYTVSVRHDWAHTTDTEDRTEEIAAEYLQGLSGGEGE